MVRHVGLLALDLKNYRSKLAHYVFSNSYSTNKKVINLVKHVNKYKELETYKSITNCKTVDIGT